MPGFKKSKIVGVSEEDLSEFTCEICLDVFKNPKCIPCCGQTYCNDCIIEWSTKQSSCPNDREDLIYEELRDPPKSLLNLLGNLKIKCSFKGNGCSNIVKIDELTNHLKHCEFSPNKDELQSLKEENSQLKNEIQNLKAINSSLHSKYTDDNENKYFYIENIESNLVLDIDRCNKNCFGKIIMYKYKGKDHQLWYYKYGMIFSKLNNLVLEIDIETLNVITYTAHRVPNQMWNFDSDNSISNNNKLYVLTVGDKEIWTEKSIMWTNVDWTHCVIVKEKDGGLTQKFKRVYI